LRPPATIEHESPDVPRAGHADEGGQGRAHGHRRRHEVVEVEDVDERHDGACRQCSLGDGEHLLEAAEPPPAAVQPEVGADDDVRDEHQRHEAHEAAQLRPAVAEVVADRQRDEERDAPREQVDAGLDGRPVAP
jgi:hypothetical protein